MSSPNRKLYLSCLALAAASLGLAVLLARPIGDLKAVRGAPPFELDEPPPVAAGLATSPP